MIEKPTKNNPHAGQPGGSRHWPPKDVTALVKLIARVAAEEDFIDEEAPKGKYN